MSVSSVRVSVVMVPQPFALAIQSFILLRADVYVVAHLLLSRTVAFVPRIYT